MSVKEDYQQQMEAKMKEWDAKLDELKAKAEGAQAETRILIKEEIKALKGKKDEVENKLEQLREAGEDAWDDLKAGVEDAWEEISHALIAARSKISS